MEARRCLAIAEKQLASVKIEQKHLEEHLCLNVILVNSEIEYYKKK